MLKKSSEKLVSPFFILCFAVTFRFVYVWLVLRKTDVPSFATAIIGDEAIRIADSIASGAGFSSPFSHTGPSAYLTPVYPYLLAGIFKVFGAYTQASFLVAVAINELFSALTCIPVYYISKRISGTQTAAIASWLWAVYPVALFVSFYSIWYSTLSTFLTAVTVWATLSIRDSERVLHWVEYGLLWGFGILTNATLMSMLAFLLGWLAWQKKATSRGRNWARLPIISFSIVVLSCLPWTIRNYVVFHEIIPLRSNLGLALWSFNNPAGPYHPYGSASEREEMARVGEVAYMKEKQKMFYEIVKANPKRFLWLSGKRFVATWVGEPNALTSLSHPAAGIRALSSFGLAILGWAGLVLLFKTMREFFLLFAAFLVVFPLPYYISFISPSYRHPIDPLLVVLAALTIARCYSRLRACAVDSVRRNIG